MRRVCVFCGSREGARPEYAKAAQELGRALAMCDLELVYGGGRVGLMGVLADAAMAAGCEVTGVIPESLHLLEIGHEGIDNLYVVESMHERKAKMAELADGFIALPGGLGTLEETFEIWTWAQLGHHRKPVALLDVAEFWRPLMGLLENMVHEGFVSAKHRRMVCMSDDPMALLAQMENWRPPEVARWIQADET
jgi:uncharacterized protein (TIGR00730 family)